MSSYFKNLNDKIVIQRYLEKISLIKNYDPYTLSEKDVSFLIGIEKCPKISYMDIVNYFVITHSMYTGDQLKAIKSLDAYKFYKAGFVCNFLAFKIGENFVFKAKVSNLWNVNFFIYMCIKTLILIYQQGSTFSKDESAFFRLMANCLA